MDGTVGADRTQAADLTRLLASKAAGFDYDDLPAAARELARQCVLDYFGVALAAAGDELVRLLLDEMAEAGGAPQASIIGHETRLPALSAALVNGAAAHALDYDDVNMAMPGHPSVAIRRRWRHWPSWKGPPAAKWSPRLSPATRPPAGSARHCSPGITISGSTRPPPSAVLVLPQPAPGSSASIPRRLRWRWASPAPKRPGSNRSSGPCASRFTPARRRRTASWRRALPRVGFRAAPTSLNASRVSR